jgi:photosystem II stability/assembly factor-like uncharacterized protein
MSRQTFLATTGHGLARASQHASGEWQVECFLAGQDVRCLAAHRTTPEVVYAGTKPARLFVSHDAGAHWAELASFRHIPGRWLWFSPAEKPYRAYVQAIALSPTDPHRIVVGMEAGAVACSLDGGQSWTGHRRGALRDCHSLTFHASNGDWVYESGGSGTGVSFSRDAGATWTQPKEGLDRHYGWAVAADPSRPEVWYASVSPAPWKAHSEHDAQAVIVRSTGSPLWQPLAGGLPQPLNHMPYALLTDPNAPGHVYAGLSNGDVWHSTDHGDTWQQLPVNVGSVRRALLLLP